jgi:hypothetical protein
MEPFTIVFQRPILNTLIEQFKIFKPMQVKTFFAKGLLLDALMLTKGSTSAQAGKIPLLSVFLTKNRQEPRIVP